MGPRQTDRPASHQGQSGVHPRTQLPDSRPLGECPRREPGSCGSPFLARNPLRVGRGPAGAPICGESSMCCRSSLRPAILAKLGPGLSEPARAAAGAIMRSILDSRNSPASSFSREQRATKPRSYTLKTIASNTGRSRGSNGQFMKMSLLLSRVVPGGAGIQLRPFERDFADGSLYPECHADFLGRVLNPSHSICNSRAG